MFDIFMMLSILFALAVLKSMVCPTSFRTKVTLLQGGYLIESGDVVYSGASWRNHKNLTNGMEVNDIHDLWLMGRYKKHMANLSIGKKDPRFETIETNTP